jgi:hypothetical protein
MSDDFADVIKKSVTADDTLTANAQGAVTVVLGPAGWSSYFSAGLLDGIKGATGLPVYGSKNADVILSESPMIENMWASAINTAISKQAALGFTVTDTNDSDRRIKQSQQLMLEYDGNFISGLSKHLRDFLTTDNGAFIEIVRQSGAAGSKIVGLKHLDSIRCYRTGDPERPLVYIDSTGRHHLLNYDDCIMFSDMPSSRVEFRGYGMCAARRAWETILKMCAMETYIREKISGSRNLAIHIVNGISSQQLEGALTSSDNGQKQKGFVVYKGSTIIPMLKNETPSLVTIPLAEIPDGFNAADERHDAYLRYANAIGLFMGDIQPLKGQGLGTGTQSVILNENAEGRGLAAWRRAFSHEITHRVFPTQTTFAFATFDLKDKKEKADTLAAWATALKTLIDSQTITPQQALNVLVDGGYMPKEFLASDSTTGGVVTDDDSIGENTNADAPPTANVQPAALPVQPLKDNLNAMRQIRRQMTGQKSYRNGDTWYDVPQPEQLTARLKALVPSRLRTRATWQGGDNPKRVVSNEEAMALINKAMRKATTTAQDAL